MRRSDTYNIIHAANYGALCIAILRPTPTSVEDAFSLYETGKAQACGGHRVNHAERLHEMAALREAGMSWEEIGLALGLKFPQCYFSNHKHLLGAVTE
jgi:hypothetical protein